MDLTEELADATQRFIDKYGDTMEELESKDLEVRCSDRPHHQRARQTNKLRAKAQVLSGVTGPGPHAWTVSTKERCHAFASDERRATAAAVRAFRPGATCALLLPCCDD